MLRFTIILLLGVVCVLTVMSEAKSDHKDVRKAKIARLMEEKRKLTEVKQKREEKTKQVEDSANEGRIAKRLVTALEKLKQEKKEEEPKPISTTKRAEEKRTARVKKTPLTLKRLHSNLQKKSSPGSGDYETPDYETPAYSGDYNTNWLEEYTDFGSGEEDYLEMLAEEFGVDIVCVGAAVEQDVPDLDALLECEGVKPVIVQMMGFAIDLMYTLPHLIEGEIWNVFFGEGGIMSVIMEEIFGGGSGSGGSGDGSDDFLCDNGKSIPAPWECDGMDDCDDNSDEAACSGSSGSGSHGGSGSGSNGFTCDNGNPIPASWECDGMDDCGDNSDEAACPESGSDDFICDNGKEIPASWECDYMDDCGDNSDEAECPEKKRNVKSLLAALKRKLSKRRGL